MATRTRRASRRGLGFYCEVEVEEDDEESGNFGVKGWSAGGRCLYCGESSGEEVKG